MTNRTLKPVIIALFTLAGAAVNAPGNAHAQGALASTASIVMKNFDFAPMTVTIRQGGSVTWKNMDDEPHTVTSLDGLFRSGALDQGESFKFKFPKKGTYKYACSIHPKMMAAVIVK